MLLRELVMYVQPVSTAIVMYVQPVSTAITNGTEVGIGEEMIVTGLCPSLLRFLECEPNVFKSIGCLFEDMHDMINRRILFAL
jgi:hypothetical protein